MSSIDIMPRWFFHRHAIGEPENTPLTEEFFKKGTRLESVIREAIQNSIDAREKDAKSVRVRVYCSGVEAALPALDYAKYRLGAEDRYADAGSGLVNAPSTTEDCVFLVIEDFQTTGLTGDIAYRPPRDEDDRAKCNYYNYFFKVNDTSSTGKNAGDTLGSWGTGKATFTRASRLKTSFAMTVRDVGEPRVFLAGKATLQVHTDENEVTWDPDGWFGYLVDVDPDDPKKSRAIPKRPVERLAEEDPVAQFVKDFRLTRADENGTSIVIPHLVLDEADGADPRTAFSRENLLRAALRNFLTAILEGGLVVEIATGDGKDQVTLDATTVGKYAHLLPDDAKEISPVTRTHYAMARDAVLKAIPQSRTLDLAHVGKGQRPEWGVPERFKELDLPALKKTLKEGKSLLFNVPLSVITKAKTGGRETKKVETDVFRVVLLRADLGRSVKPVFYRLGLLIDSVSVQAVPNYAAVVLVDRGPLAKVLVASEPPSHAEWSKDADKVKAICYGPREHIQFVTTAAREILEAIDNSDKTADWDPLADAFGIPDDSGVEERKRPIKEPGKDDTKKDPVDPPGGGGGDPIPEPILNIEKIDEPDRRGFAIFVKPERVVEQGYPCSATYTLGFAPLSDTGWSRHDFLLQDKDEIAIVVVQDPGKDPVLTYSAVDNKLTVTLLRQGAARIEVTGFEKDRDLEWKKGGYVYGKGEE